MGDKKEKKVVLFTTSIGSSIQTKKAQQSLRWLLEKKGIDFTELDIFLDPKAREDLLQKTNEPSLSSLASSNPLPLLFFDDKLIGVLSPYFIFSLISHLSSFT